MHVEASIGFLFEHFIQRPRKQSEVEHPLRERPDRRVVRLVPAFARARFAHRRILRGQHEFIDRALRSRKSAVHRKSARDVRGVAVQFAPGVDQQEIAVGHGRVVAYVMEDAGVRAGGDNRRVGRVLRSPAPECIQKLGLDLVFVPAGTRRPHRTAMAVSGDAGGAAHGCELGRILDQAHFIEGHAQVGNAGGRRYAEPHFLAHRIEPAHDSRIPSCIRSGRIVQDRLVGEQPGHLFVQRVDGIRLVESEFLARGLGAIPEAVPDFAFRAFLPAKKDRSRRIPGNEYQHRFGLCEPGQVMEVAVKAIGIVRIAIADVLGSGGQDRDARMHPAGQPLAATGECAGCDY